MLRVLANQPPGQRLCFVVALLVMQVGQRFQVLLCGVCRVQWSAQNVSLSGIFDSERCWRQVIAPARPHHAQHGRKVI